MEVNYNINALSMTGLTPQSQVNSDLNEQIAENTANIATINLELDTIDINLAQIPINTADIATNTNAIATNTNAIATNTNAIATIQYDISEIPVLLGITNINTHGDQYGENGEVYNTNGFDTTDYSHITIDLPLTTFYFSTTYDNQGTSVYTVITPSADNQITKYRFQIPISVKANGTTTSSGQDVRIASSIPTQYYVIKNGDIFNPIVGSITSSMGGTNLPKSMNTIAS
jgi:hypothetical protein